MKTKTKKQLKGESDLLSKTNAINKLKELNGKKVSSLTKVEQETLLLLVCQLLGIVDDKEKIKSI